VSVLEHAHALNAQLQQQLEKEKEKPAAVERSATRNKPSSRPTLPLLLCKVDDDKAALSPRRDRRLGREKKKLVKATRHLVKPSLSLRKTALCQVKGYLKKAKATPCHMPHGDVAIQVVVLHPTDKQ
jgi:hypothetical protein